METISHTSQSIKETVYDKNTQELIITFDSSKVYTYTGVPNNVYEEFISSTSKGNAFISLIKNNYTFTQK